MLTMWSLALLVLLLWETPARGQQIGFTNENASEMLYAFDTNGVAYFLEGQWIAYTRPELTNRLATSYTSTHFAWSMPASSTIYVTNDGGFTWYSKRVETVTVGSTSVSGQYMISGSSSSSSEGYVQYSLDYGLDWSMDSLKVSIYGVASDATGQFVFMTTSLGAINASTDYGVQFAYAVDSGLNFSHVACDGSGDNVVAVVTPISPGAPQYLMLYQNWTSSRAATPGTQLDIFPPSSGAAISCVAISREGGVIAAASPYGSLFVSTDLGATWGEIPFSSPYAWNSLSVSYDGQTIGASFSTNETNGFNLFLSSDRGASFAQIFLKEPPTCLPGFGFNFPTTGLYVGALVPNACNLCMSSEDSEAFKFYNDGTSAECMACPHYPVYVSNNFDSPLTFAAVSTHCIRACSYPFFPSNTINWQEGADGVVCGHLWLQTPTIVSVSLALTMLLLYAALCTFTHVKFNESKGLLRAPRSCADLWTVLRGMDYSLVRSFVLLTGLPMLDSVSDMLYVLNSKFYSEVLFASAMSFFILAPVVMLSANLWRYGARPAFRLWALPDYAFRLVGHQTHTIFHIAVVVVACLPQLLVNALFLGPWLMLGIFLHMSRTMTLGLLHHTWYTVWTGKPPTGAAHFFLMEHYNEELYGGILMEALPQLLIQIVNTTHMREWTPITRISIIFSGLMVTNGAYQMIYFKLFRGEKLRKVERGISKTLWDVEPPTTEPAAQSTNPLQCVVAEAPRESAVEMMEAGSSVVSRRFVEEKIEELRRSLLAQLQGEAKLCDVYATREEQERLLEEVTLAQAAAAEAKSDCAALRADIIERLGDLGDDPHLASHPATASALNRITSSL